MKLALYQGSGTLLDVSANLSLLAQMAAKAANQQADFLVFPELFLTGYNIGDDVMHLAEAWQGRSLQYVASIAQEYNLALLVGYAEQSGDRIYNSAALIDATGQFVGNYRKTHLFGTEERRLFTPGNQWVVQSIAGMNVGVLICFDVEFPEAVRTLAAQGAELIAVPTANMFPYTKIPTCVVPVRALENQVFVAYANRIGTEGTLKYCGLSTIAAPDGTVLAQANEDETLLFATIDRTAIAQARSSYSYIDERCLTLYQ
jgi:predicted amidohydrolase